MKTLTAILAAGAMAASALGQQPILRNPWSTNVSGTAVLGHTNLSITNVGSGVFWQFHGTNEQAVARLVDVTNVTSYLAGVATNTFWFTNTSSPYGISNAFYVKIGSLIVRTNLDLDLGNITFVPVGNNTLQAYVNAAAPGDTLVLGSGSYTNTTGITITNSINIIGQGTAGSVTDPETAAHGTRFVITANTQTAFTISTNNVRIANLDIFMVGANSIGVLVNSNRHGITLADMGVNIEGGSSAHGIVVNASDACLRNISTWIYCSNAGDAYGLLVTNGPTSSISSTCDVFNATMLVRGTSGNAYGFRVHNGNTANKVSLNLHNSECKLVEVALVTDVALASTSTTTSNAIVNAFLSTFDSGGGASDYDVYQTGTNVMALGGSVVVNNKIFGVPTYRAAMVSGIVQSPQLYGGILDNEDLKLDGTLSATKTTSYVLLQGTGGNVGIGTNAPQEQLHLTQNLLVDSNIISRYALFHGNGGGLSNISGVGINVNTAHFYTNLNTLSIKDGAYVTNLNMVTSFRTVPGTYWLSNDFTGDQGLWRDGAGWVWRTHGGQDLFFDGASVVGSTTTIFYGNGSGLTNFNYPSTAYELANKGYVDSVSTFGQTWYVWGSSNSIVTNCFGTNYKVMQKADVAMTTTIVTNSYANLTNGNYVGMVISAIPAGLTSLKPGNYISSSYAWRSTGGGDAVTITPEFYIRTNLTYSCTEGEREIAAGNPLVLDGTPGERLQSVQITTNVVLDSTSYLVRKYKLSGVAGTPTVYFSSQGGRPAYITVPIPSSAFVLSAGDNMSGNLSLDAGAKFYGDGSGLSNITSVSLVTENLTNPVVWNTLTFYNTNAAFAYSNNFLFSNSGSGLNLYNNFKGRASWYSVINGDTYFNDRVLFFGGVYVETNTLKSLHVTNDLASSAPSNWFSGQVVMSNLNVTGTAGAVSRFYDPVIFETNVGIGFRIFATNIVASMAVVTDADQGITNHTLVSAAELGYLDGVTGGIQTNIANRVVLSGGTATNLYIYGNQYATNWTYTDSTGWWSTNNQAASQGVHIYRGNIDADGTLSVVNLNVSTLTITNAITNALSFGVNTPTNGQILSASSGYLFWTNAPYLMGGSAAWTPSATATYYPIVGQLATSTTEADVSVPVPCSGTLSRLFVKVKTTPSSGTNFVFTIFTNGVASGITVTVAAGATTGSDLTHTAPCLAGDLISLEADATEAEAANNVRWSILY